MVLNFVLNWALPFLALLPRPAKRNSRMLMKVCVVLLVGRWLDLYLMIMPPIVGEVPTIGIWEVGMVGGAVGVFVLVFAGALRAAPIVPSKDPFFAESLHHHQ